METKYFLLEGRDNSKATKIFQLALGVLCIVIAVYWIVFNLRSIRADRTQWITIVFLFGFGLFGILAGLGKTVKYIEITGDRINLKQNSVLPVLVLKPDDISKIEIFPLSIVFSGRKNNRHILRFGINYPEIIDPVKDAVTEFADANKLGLEFKEENV